ECILNFRFMVTQPPSGCEQYLSCLVRMSRAEILAIVEESYFGELRLMSKLAPAESISILRAEPLLGLAFLDHAGSQLKSEASCERSHGVARPRRFPTNCRGHFLPASCRAHHNRLSSCFPYGTLFCMQPSRSKRPA